MRARGIRAGVALAMAVLCLAPAGAAAKPGYKVRDGGFAALLRAPGNDGWRLSVVALGHRQISVDLSKGLMSASYVVRGRASSRGIRANLGKLGRIAVRFDPAPARFKAQRFADNCTGTPGVVAPGSWRGTIRFRGELGFTTVDARQAGGVYRRWHRSICKRRDGPIGAGASARKRPPKLVFNVFGADEKVRGRQTSFFLLQLDLSGPKAAEAGSFTIAGAARGERRGRIAISRSYVYLGDKQALLGSDPGAYPLEATVAMPSPFSGTAAFHEDLGADPTWEGDLSVWLPGAGKVPLAGEGFRAALCRASGKPHLRTCLKQMESELPSSARAGGRRPLAQISGSQSQVLGDARLSWAR
jgi:hypothetical protein